MTQKGFAGNDYHFVSNMKDSKSYLEKLFKKRKVRQVDVTIKIPRVSTIMSLCSENYKSFERCIKTEKINQLSSFYYTYRDTALSMIYTEEDCTAPEMIPTPK